VGYIRRAGSPGSTAGKDARRYEKNEIRTRAKLEQSDNFCSRKKGAKVTGQGFSLSLLCIFVAMVLIDLL
jgi:hypothetical protein